MTPERWRQIEEIFHEALELDDGARGAFLKESADGDEELRDEVEKLLAQLDDASSFIEQPLYDSAKSGVLQALLDDSDDDPMVGKLLGNYRIEREIGRGGMGAVYEAYRADGEFRLRVALKVVKRGVDTDFVLRRFRNERQILAALDHPFITRLIDGGTTDDGRPYFVMEFIDGLPLYRACDRERLSIEERLKLFCRVCEAVEYAHQKLIIHRDLKPSNIFIANDSSPRLLDFGIAKLLDPEMAIDTLRPTATALRMMTVDYASPEQIRGEKVTYATDTYSLGVILFELLTGFRPYRLDSRSPHDVARAICDDEPSLPSEALSPEGERLPAVPVNSSATTLTDAAELRSQSPSELRSQLRGNLDNIILKALQKMPEQRYGSVAALRDDIERHLRGESVSIRDLASSPRPHRMGSDDSQLLAVLPLSLMNAAGAQNTDEAYLTVGLADAIITRLTSVRKLIVRPTSSITRYNDGAVNPFRAGVELGVDFVLDGRIRRFGERLRISLQLLDVAKGTAIWAGQFDEHLTDVLALEDAISEQVVAALIPQLTGEDRQRFSKRGTNNPQAYEAYLKGRFCWNQFTADAFPRSIEWFQKAVELDPNFAMAHVGVADFYIWANIYGIIPSAESYGQAEISINKALAIDDQLGEAYATLALLESNRFDWDEGRRLHKKAIELAPNYPYVHEWYSANLVGSGEFDEGAKAIARAEELDPLSLRTKTLVAWTMYQAHRFDDALAKANEIIELDANYPQGHLQRSNILTTIGRADEAVAAIDRARDLMPGSSMTNHYLCFALVAVGRTPEARAVLDGMKNTDAYVKPMFLALASLALGEIADTFRYLNQAADEFDPWLIWLGTEPKFAPIHRDKHYLELLKRTNNPRFAHFARQASSDAEKKIETVTGPTPAEATTLEFEKQPTGGIAGLPFKTSFLHRQRFKFGLAGVLLVLIVVGYATGILTVQFSRGPAAAQVGTPATQSIAVLPFENNTGDPGNDYISDGMSDSLNSRISRSPEIRTVPRSAAFAYRSRKLGPQDIGRELGVDSVLTGTLQRINDDYMLRVEMTAVADGGKLMSISFVEKPENILSVLDPLSSRVVESLNLKLAAPVTAQKSYTENTAAFQLYLKGEYSRQKGTPAGTTESIDLYNQAIAIDANYALAYQGLALAYRSAPSYGSMLPKEAYPKAKAAAEKALAIDPALATAYVSLASIRSTYDWDFSGAEEEYKKAIQLGPNNAEAHYSYGNFLVAMGRSDEGLVELRNAQQIDPLSLNTLTNIAWALYIAGRYDEALTQIRQVIAKDPSVPRAYMNLGEILQEQGKFDEAIAAFQKARELSSDPLADMALGHVYATAGRRNEAQKIATQLEEKAREKIVSPFLPAVVYAGLNEKDKSFYWLERAYQDRSNWLTLIKVGRRLKNLHGDPRFDDLLKRVGFDIPRL